MKPQTHTVSVDALLYHPVSKQLQLDYSLPNGFSCWQPLECQFEEQYDAFLNGWLNAFHRRVYKYNCSHPEQSQWLLYSKPMPEERLATHRDIGWKHETKAPTEQWPGWKAPPNPLNS